MRYDMPRMPGKHHPNPVSMAHMIVEALALCSVPEPVILAPVSSYMVTSSRVCSGFCIPGRCDGCAPQRWSAGDVANTQVLGSSESMVLSRAVTLVSRFRGVAVLDCLGGRL